MPTHAELVTPERVLFSGEADFAVMRSEGGEIMFLPNHADFVGALDITLVRFALAGTEAAASAASHETGRAPAAEVRAAVHGGLVHVAGNRVLVLASVAELSGEIDVERARRALDAAESAAAAVHEEAPKAGHEGSAEEGAEQSPTMMALLRPDDPEVAARRARARLEAAGVLEASAPGNPPGH